MVNSGEDRSILSRDGGSPDLQLTYGAQADQVVDVWRASAPSRGSLLLLHGGFWADEYDRAHLRPMAAALQDAGLDVLLPEYRRVGGAGGWPATFDDVRASAEVLDEFASPVVLVGHSAGAQLALWLAATQPPDHLVAVVALAAVTDLIAAHRLGLGEGAVEKLMGGTPTEVPERYAIVDPAQLPTPRCVVRLLHGRNDTLVPPWMSTEYAQRLDVTVGVVDGGHFELVDPTTAHFASVMSALSELT